MWTVKQELFALVFWDRRLFFVGSKTEKKEYFIKRLVVERHLVHLELITLKALKNLKEY